MKKYLLMLALLPSLLMFAAEDGTSWQTAYSFDWENGNQVAASASKVWYKVDLSGIEKDENILLYLNNLNAETATVTVEAFIAAGSNTQSIEDATTREILANHNYAKEISRALFGSISEVYITIVTNRDLKFSAEPVEAGEKDVACLNATEIDLSAATTFAANKEAWYKVDLSSIVAKTDKTLRIKLTNNSSSKATVVTGLSFDCPATGVTEKTETIAANSSRSTEIKHSYYQLLPEDNVVYVKVKADASVTLTTEEVDAVAEETISVGTDPVTNFVEETEYTVSNESKWFKIDIRDWYKRRQMPELTIENTGSTTAKLKAEVIFATSGVPMVQTSSLSAGSKQEREIQRNMVETAATNAGTDSVAYVRVTSDGGTIVFSARMKANLEGTECTKAKEFSWANGELQSAETTQWYAVSLVDAKAERTADDLGKDILLTVTNKGAATANVKAQIAFVCPCETTTPQSKSIAAGKTLTKRILYSLYNSTSDTIWVGLTTNQNIQFSAELVDPEDYTDPNPCDPATAVTFDVETGLDVDATNSPVWVKVLVADVLDDVQLPVVKVTNRTSNKAQVTGRFSYDCAEAKQALQTRTITVAADGEYTKEVSKDMIETLEEGVTAVYFEITTDQDIHIDVEMVNPNEGISCLNPIVFDWENGNDHPAGQTLWYRVDLDTLVVETDKDLLIQIKNIGENDSQVKAQLSYECPIDNIAEVGDRVVKVGDTMEKSVSRGAIEAVRPQFEPVYIRIESEELVHFSVELINDLPLLYDTTYIDTILCAGDRFDYDTDKGGAKTILVDHTYQWTDTIHGIKDKTREIDSLFVYTVRPITAPLLITPEVKPVVEADSTLNYAAATADLLDKLQADAEANDTVAKTTAIHWMWRGNDGLFVDYVDGVKIDLYETEDSLALSYWIEAGCDSEVEWLDEEGENQFILVFYQDLQVEPEVREATIDTLLCKGTELDINSKLIVINSDTTIVDTLQLTVDGVLVDSVYTYNVKLYKDLVLPSNFDIRLNAVCGLDINVDTLMVELDSMLAEMDLDSVSPIDTIYWELKYNDKYIALDSVTPHFGEKLAVRLVAVTACDTVRGADFKMSVDMPSSLNNPEVIPMVPARMMYNGWVVMLNRVELRELGYDPTEEEVVWYKVISGEDRIYDDKGPWGDDLIVGKGFYYTRKDGPLEGKYYALIIQQPTIENECGVVMRSDILENTNEAAPQPQLVSSFVDQDEQVTVINLLADENYQIRVCNTVGDVIKTDKVMNQEFYSFKAETPAGCYMVNLLSEKMNVTLKYIVK